MSVHAEAQQGPWTQVTHSKKATAVQRGVQAQPSTAKGGRRSSQPVPSHAHQANSSAVQQPMHTASASSVAAHTGRRRKPKSGKHAAALEIDHVHRDDNTEFSVADLLSHSHASKQRKTARTAAHFDRTGHASLHDGIARDSVASDVVCQSSFTTKPDSDNQTGIMEHCSDAAGQHTEQAVSTQKLSAIQQAEAWATQLPSAARVDWINDQLQSYDMCCPLTLVSCWVPCSGTCTDCLMPSHVVFCWHPHHTDIHMPSHGVPSWTPQQTLTSSCPHTFSHLEVHSSKHRHPHALTCCLLFERTADTDILMNSAYQQW